MDSSVEEDLIDAPTKSILRNISYGKNQDMNADSNQNEVQHYIEVSEENIISSFDENGISVKMEKVNYHDDVPVVFIEVNRRIQMEINENLMGES